MFFPVDWQMATGIIVSTCFSLAVLISAPFIRKRDGASFVLTLDG